VKGHEEWGPSVVNDLRKRQEEKISRGESKSKIQVGGRAESGDPERGRAGSTTILQGKCEGTSTTGFEMAVRLSVSRARQAWNGDPLAEGCKRRQQEQAFLGMNAQPADNSCMARTLIEKKLPRVKARLPKEYSAVDSEADRREKGYRRSRLTREKKLRKSSSVPIEGKSQIGGGQLGKYKGASCSDINIRIQKQHTPIALIMATAPIPDPKRNRLSHSIFKSQSPDGGKKRGKKKNNTLGKKTFALPRASVERGGGGNGAFKSQLASPLRPERKNKKDERRGNSLIMEISSPRRSRYKDIGESWTAGAAPHMMLNRGKVQGQEYAGRRGQNKERSGWLEGLQKRPRKKKNRIRKGIAPKVPQRKKPLRYPRRGDHPGPGMVGGDEKAAPPQVLAQ